MKEFTCQNCGKRFNGYGDRKYCSPECYHEAQRRPERLEIECYHCGKKSTAYWDNEREQGADWAADGFKGYIKTGGKNKENMRWLCDECDGFRCEECSALLSKDFYQDRVLEKSDNEEIARQNLEKEDRVWWGYYTEESLPLCWHCYQKVETP